LPECADYKRLCVWDFNDKGMFLRAKFDGLLACSMHPIAVQVKPVAAAGIGRYRKTKIKKGFLLVWAEFWAIDPTDTRRTHGARRQC
jgi:hypothetical protein